MTDVRNPLDPTARWRATIDAMEAVMLAAPDAPEIEPTEAEEIRRLIPSPCGGRVARAG